LAPNFYGRAGTGLGVGATRLDHGQGPRGGGRPKKSSAPLECLGRSRGGFTTKVHAVVDALGNGVHLDLTPGQQADCLLVPDLLAALPQEPGKVVADKAYDTNAVLQSIAAHQAEQVIPPKSNRKVPRDYDENLSDDRNKMERFFGRLKQSRAFATRYDKTALSFLAVAHIVAALDWLR
jgi:transposase